MDVSFFVITQLRVSSPWEMNVCNTVYIYIFSPFAAFPF